MSELGERSFRQVRDSSVQRYPAELAFDVIAGPDPRDRLSIPDEGVGWSDAAQSTERLGLTVAYCPEWGGVPVDPEVRAIVDDAALAFECGLGCHVSLEPAPFAEAQPLLGS